MAYVPNSGSVVAFQGTVPFSVAGVITGSVISVQQGSVAAVIIGGSIAASFTPPANQSVSGTVGASVIGAVPINVQSSVATVIIGGSIASVPNQSVSGVVGASIIGIGVTNQADGGTSQFKLQTDAFVRLYNGSNYDRWRGDSSVGGLVNTGASSVITISQGSIAAVIIGGSILTSSTANQSVSGAVNVSSLISIPAIISAANSTTAPVTSTLSFTGTGEEWKDFATIIVNVFTDAASGTDGLSIQQSSDNVNWDIRDTYTVPSMAAGQGKTFGVQPAARFGRVVYTQGAVNSGAFRLQTLYHPQFVKPSSQRASDGYTNETDLEQIQGFNMVYNGTTWDRMRGTTSGALITGSVQATISGSVVAFQAGTQITSLVSIVPSSVLVGASIMGQLPAGTAMLGSIAAYQGAVWNVAGSVAAFQVGTWTTSVMTNVITSIATAGQVMGSVAALQATNPWNIAGSVAAFVVGSSSIITRSADSSILSVPVGSVITVFQAPSIVGTYAEDAPSASGDKGFLVMGARNDTLASVTSNDGDYSSHVVGPAGELIAANAPFTKWVSGTASMLGGVPLTCSVTVIAAQGSSIFTYVTGVQVVNFSASSVLVSFGAATSSLIGYTIAPAGGGSNIVFPNALKTNANAAFSASVSGTSSIFISAQGFISKT